LAYKNTGVANYLSNLVATLIEQDKKNDYILFFSSLRKTIEDTSLDITKLPSNVRVKSFRFSPKMLDVLWNRLHVLPVEWLVGKIDIFITSDWTEPPASNAQKITILYDLVVYKHPEESATIIVQTQKRKLAWVKKESSKILCISEATKKDAHNVLGISKDKLSVIYPGSTM
jgi:hypothetical protein